MDDRDSIILRATRDAIDERVSRLNPGSPIHVLAAAPIVNVDMQPVADAITKFAEALDRQTATLERVLAQLAERTGPD